MNERNQVIEEYKVELDHIKQLVLLMDDILIKLGETCYKFENTTDSESSKRLALAFSLAYDLNRVYDRMNTLNSIQLEKVSNLTNEIDGELKSSKY